MFKALWNNGPVVVLLIAFGCAVPEKGDDSVQERAPPWSLLRLPLDREPIVFDEGEAEHEESTADDWSAMPDGSVEGDDDSSGGRERDRVEIDLVGHDAPGDVPVSGDFPLPGPVVTDTGHVELAPEEEPYRAFLENSPTAQSEVTPPILDIPPNYVPWWKSQVGEPLKPASPRRDVKLDGLILDALSNSPRVRAINNQSFIAETLIVEAEAEFDVRSFVESRFVRTSDPVGNLLTTGGPPRLRDSDFAFEAGLRRRTRRGGTFEFSQKIGLQDSNSIYFDPLHQGNARLSLSYTHPLLNGAGEAFNSSLIVLADIDTAIAVGRTSQELQDHLLRVSEAYWLLYLRRANLLQKQRHYFRAETILRHLEHRRDIDVLRSQLVRGNAAVATRRAELTRAAGEIEKAEAELRALVDSAHFAQNPYVEIVPLETPSMVRVDVRLRDAMLTALRNRPELDQAMQKVRAASVRLNMSKNQLLPTLDVVLETYLSGLDGDYGIGQSLVDQFSEGEPSYTVGLVAAFPLGNRAALARNRRRKLELQQVTSGFEDTVQNMFTDVQVAVREVDTSYREMQAKYHALVAQQAEVAQYQRLWEVLPGEEVAAGVMLENLLDAQDRLASAEFDFARAQVAYMMSVIRLKRATGTLLQYEEIDSRGSPARPLAGESGSEFPRP